MKIHIVQKGDTLWNLAKKYGVSFEEVKQLNAQLADPDQIMPGMKIKIPTNTKQVQKKPTNDKTMHPYKDTTKKAQPVIQEDDVKKTTPVKKQMPEKTMMQPEKPKMEAPQPTQPIELPKLPNFYSNNYNIDVDIDDNDLEINQHSTQQTYHAPQPQQPAQSQPIQQPMMPIYCFMHPCMPMHPMPTQMQPMQHTPPCGPMPMQQPMIDPCVQFQSPDSFMPMQEGAMPYQGDEDLESSSVDVPPPPMQDQSKQNKHYEWNMNPNNNSNMYNMPQSAANDSMMPNLPGNEMNQMPGMSMPHDMEPGINMPYYPTQEGAQPNMEGPAEGNMSPYMGGPMQGDMPPYLGGQMQGNMPPHMGSPMQGNMPPHMGSPMQGNMPPYMGGTMQGMTPPMGTSPYPFRMNRDEEDNE
ncbi:hypothetical protein GCM10011351_11610 [Paraliobacillus quinghaiensis]|uniref:LysM domain-containing protein n=1 Tax=Paraliobacillus quinghaiensis TaxID=470815 RepID=A0A917TMC8_9BACI|nr:SafA/ExsA family spore coat assembly protein [Paraliobacillus quinghaiensis]GGM27415.1 hypothetical protein GCM10011351_11610 [Paraliobacillus quinghaiensis]